MADRVVWSPEAIEDVEAIATYIERDSTVYAQSVVSKIVQTSQRVGDFSHAGRVVPEIGDENIRELFVLQLQTRV